MSLSRYRNRQQAGAVLAEKLLPYREENILVLAVPRGGVPVAVPIARTLDAELDLIIPRKITTPQQPELAVGAVCEDGEVLLNRHLVNYFKLSREDIDRLAAGEVAEIKRRLQLYRGGRPPAAIGGRTVIVVDDGVATGFTITAALRFARKKQPRKLILAVPVAPPDTVAKLAGEADVLVCPLQPEFFTAVGQFYDEFPQLTDREVISFLAKEQ
ncbi:MAG: phosphoribosyltransferase [Firmicutes bacterium]|jgi:predicted phosphoribosyltransferase|nr:phosphoribosyltransferase [Bacillota bacterium]